MAIASRDGLGLSDLHLTVAVIIFRVIITTDSC